MEVVLVYTVEDLMAQEVLRQRHKLLQAAQEVVALEDQTVLQVVIEILIQMAVLMEVVAAAHGFIHSPYLEVVVIVDLVECVLFGQVMYAYIQQLA